MTQLQFGWVLPMPAAMPAGQEHLIRSPLYLKHLSRVLPLVAKNFHAVWCCDHLQDQVLEAWTLLTYLAPLYPQLHFGHLVLNQSFRNPALLAKMAATFHYMSSGRLILGMGAGWNEEEHRAYGYPFPSGQQRVAKLEEALQVIKALWQNECASLQGEHFQLAEARCGHRPVPAPPILIGGAKPRILNSIARYADWWSADRPSLPMYRSQIALCEQACLAVQRDPRSLRRTWFGLCICRPTEQALQPFGGRDEPERSFIGTPSQIIERMQEFIELGVDYFMFLTEDGPDMTTLELLASEVFPALNRERDVVTQVF